MLFFAFDVENWSVGISLCPRKTGFNPVKLMCLKLFKDAVGTRVDTERLTLAERAREAVGRLDLERRVLGVAGGLVSLVLVGVFQEGLELSSFAEVLIRFARLVFARYLSSSSPVLRSGFALVGLSLVLSSLDCDFVRLSEVVARAKRPGWVLNAEGCPAMESIFLNSAMCASLNLPDFPFAGAIFLPPTPIKLLPPCSPFFALSASRSVSSLFLFRAVSSCNPSIILRASGPRVVSGREK